MEPSPAPPCTLNLPPEPPALATQSLVKCEPPVREIPEASNPETVSPQEGTEHLLLEDSRVTWMRDCFSESHNPVREIASRGAPKADTLLLPFWFICKDKKAQPPRSEEQLGRHRTQTPICLPRKHWGRTQVT